MSAELRELPRNNRGVALIIVLLVTALLIALIFEFAYGTRISLRAAANFRDSQRAYFLARSGLGVFAKWGPTIRDLVKQGQWSGPIPYVSEGDTLLELKWEDESGKISIANVTRNTEGYNRLSKLFDILQINQDFLDQISAWSIQNQSRFYLITELHRFLNDEDYGKIQDLLTVTPQPQININTASAAVLQSLGLSASDAESIVKSATEKPYDANTIGTAPGVTPLILGQLITTSNNIFKISCRATVGGYMKQIEAVITLSGTQITLNYWRAL